MLIRRNLGHRGHRVPLTSSRKQQQLIVVHLASLRRADEYTVGNVQLAKTLGNFNISQHASAQQCHSAAVVAREVEHDLNPVNRTGETAQYDSPLRFFEYFLECRNNRAFGLRASGAFGVSRVRQQREDAAVAVFDQALEIRRGTDYRRVVYLK